MMRRLIGPIMLKQRLEIIARTRPHSALDGDLRCIFQQPAIHTLQARAPLLRPILVKIFGEKITFVESYYLIELIEQGAMILRAIRLRHAGAQPDLQLPRRGLEEIRVNAHAARWKLQNIMIENDICRGGTVPGRKARLKRSTQQVERLTKGTCRSFVRGGRPENFLNLLTMQPVLVRRKQEFEKFPDFTAPPLTSTDGIQFSADFEPPQRRYDKGCLGADHPCPPEMRSEQQACSLPHPNQAETY